MNDAARLFYKKKEEYARRRANDGIQGMFRGMNYVPAEQIRNERKQERALEMQRLKNTGATDVATIGSDGKIAVQRIANRGALARAGLDAKTKKELQKRKLADIAEQKRLQREFTTDERVGKQNFLASEALLQRQHDFDKPQYMTPAFDPQTGEAYWPKNVNVGTISEEDINFLSDEKVADDTSSATTTLKNYTEKQSGLRDVVKNTGPVDLSDNVIFRRRIPKGVNLLQYMRDNWQPDVDDYERTPLWKTTY